MEEKYTKKRLDLDKQVQDPKAKFGHQIKMSENLNKFAFQDFVQSKSWTWK